MTLEQQMKIWKRAVVAARREGREEDEKMLNSRKADVMAKHRKRRCGCGGVKSYKAKQCWMCMLRTRYGDARKRIKAAQPPVPELSV